MVYKLKIYSLLSNREKVNVLKVGIKIKTGKKQQNARIR